MNLFVTSECPTESARYMDDKRATKMLLESAQMLSLAISEHGGVGPYKDSHKSHPISVWSRQTRSNYLWLLKHFKALCDRYTKVYGKKHKSSYLYNQFLEGAELIPKGSLTPFVNCARNKQHFVDFSHVEDVYEAYRQYLDYRWKFTDKYPPKRFKELI